MNALDRISVAATGVTVADLEAETQRIGVGTGIAWAFTRSPFIHAIGALDVDEMSGGRFRLGMGAGVKRLNETWHNAEYGRPAPHLREAIEATRLIMRQASAGQSIRYQGTYYDIDIEGWIRPRTAVREAVPIYAAAPQAGMARMATDVEATAERADGPFLTPPTYFISPEELSEFQSRIIDAFGPGT